MLLKKLMAISVVEPLCGPEPTLKTGTFHLAGNRNFLFGSDSG